MVSDTKVTRMSLQAAFYCCQIIRQAAPKAFNFNYYYYQDGPQNTATQTMQEVA